MNGHPDFQDRYHAIAFHKSRLLKLDDELQAYIQLKLKEMQKVRELILWNESELRKEQKAKQKTEVRVDDEIQRTIL